MRQKSTELESHEQSIINHSSKMNEWMKKQETEQMQRKITKTYVHDNGLLNDNKSHCCSQQYYTWLVIEQR